MYSLQKENIPKPNLDNLLFVEHPSSAYIRQAVYKFWYQVYHSEMKRKITDLNHSKKIIYDDLEPVSTLYTIQQYDETIASVRLSEVRTLINSKYCPMLANYSFEKAFF